MRGFRGCSLSVGKNKAAANRKENLLRQQSDIAVEGGKTHAIGMRGNIGDGIHLVAMKYQVLRFIEGDDVVTGQFQFFGGANGGEFRFNLRGIDAFRSFTGESKQDSAVGAMSQTSERQ